MRGIHPKPYSHGLKMSKLNEHINKKNQELANMVLPKITHRKLEDVTDPNALNPFKVQRNTEKLLRFRERQRELEKLENIKQRIEHKYMYGQDLMNQMSQVAPPGKASTSVKQDRTGMIREIKKIKAMPMPEHMRAHSVKPERSKPKTKSIFALDDLENVTRSLDSPEAASPKSVQPTSPTYKSMTVGQARFKTPAPTRPLSIVDDPLRYLKQKSNDQKESIQDYVDSARKMLQFNVSILDKQQQVEQLRDMIKDEEQKLNVAKQAFEEDTQRFNTFLFEARQVGDRLEEQYKEKDEESRGLDMQIVDLRTKIEDVDAETQFKEEECAKFKQNL